MSVFWIPISEEYTYLSLWLKISKYLRRMVIIIIIQKED